MESEDGMHHRGIGPYSAGDGSGVDMLDLLRYQVPGAIGVVLCFCLIEGLGYLSRIDPEHMHFPM
jgi:hypothetical protein